jgi:hypothetical protein
VRTVHPVHWNIAIGAAVIVVARHKVSLGWNRQSRRNRNGSDLQTRKAKVGLGRIVIAQTKVAIGQIVGLVIGIVQFNVRALVLAHGGMNHEFRHYNRWRWGSLRRNHGRTANNGCCNDDFCHGHSLVWLMAIALCVRVPSQAECAAVRKKPFQKSALEKHSAFGHLDCQ